MKYSHHQLQCVDVCGKLKNRVERQSENTITFADNIVIMLIKYKVTF